MTASTTAEVRVLVIDDEELHAQSTAEMLSRAGYTCATATSGADALRLLDEEPFDLVIADLVMHDMDGLEVLRQAKKRLPDVEVIIMTGYASVESAVEAMQQGAATYLRKPLDLRETRAVVQRVVEKQKLARENIELQKQLDKRYGFHGIIGSTEAMHQIFDTLQQVAPATVTVLIQGESGTGKELIARAIHQNSKRRSAPFVPLNCAALTESILESELFGHEKGAFTGALFQHKGRFEFAHHGTLFLDEIGDMPLTTQAKLLRAVENGEIIRVGSNTPIKVDVRLLAATNRRLEDLVRDGKFREDLYYRLKVVTITLPPLRERPGDMPLLISHFLKEYAEVHAKAISGIAPNAAAFLSSYPWPGNVRELKNCLESMVATSRKEQLGVEDIPEYIMRREGMTARPAGLDPWPAGSHPAAAGSASGGSAGAPFTALAGMNLEKVEEELIKATLSLVGGARDQAAKRLGISERTLYRKIKEYKIP